MASTRQSITRRKECNWSGLLPSQIPAGFTGFQGWNGTNGHNSFAIVAANFIDGVVINGQVVPDPQAIDPGVRNKID